MAGMYGLGYGAGVAAAGLGQGMVQGMQAAPQMEAMGLQNQQRQMSVDEQKAMQQEYALAPQVLADPALRDANGNIDAAQLMSRLPHTGASYLNAAAGANMKAVQAKYWSGAKTDLTNSQAGLADANATKSTTQAAGMQQAQDAQKAKDTQDFFMRHANAMSDPKNPMDETQKIRYMETVAKHDFEDTLQKQYPGLDTSMLDHFDVSDPKLMTAMRQGNIQEVQAFLQDNLREKQKADLIKNRETNAMRLSISQSPYGDPVIKRAEAYRDSMKNSPADNPLGLDPQQLFRKGLELFGPSQPRDQAAQAEKMKVIQKEMSRLEGGGLDPTKIDALKPNDPMYGEGKLYKLYQGMVKDRLTKPSGNDAYGNPETNPPAAPTKPSGPVAPPATKTFDMAKYSGKKLVQDSSGNYYDYKGNGVPGQDRDKNQYVLIGKPK